MTLPWMPGAGTMSSPTSPNSSAARPACFCRKSPDNAVLSVDHCVGVEPRYLQSYKERYSTSCPLARVPLIDALRIVNLPELVPYNEYLQGQFYQEWAQPQGWLDVANIIVEKSQTCCSIFSVVRDDASGWSTTKCAGG